MARKYFGTDGIRGQVGMSPITPDFVMRLGYAAGKVLASYGEANTTGARDSKRSFTSVAYDHQLSKRTDVYAVVMFDKLKGQDRAATTALGVRHNF